VTQGTYNFINPSAGAIKPDDLRINTVDNAKSSFTIYDLKGSSEIVQLPAGPLAVAAGIEYRNEKRKADPDAAKVAGEVIGFGSARVDGSRNVSSFYAELSVPILKNLESQWAVRTDKYSDYGRSTTPKLGLKWKALQTLAFRGSYAKGFRAPSLTEISPSSVTAFTAITDPKRCITGNEPDCSRTVAALSQNAKTLDPETAKTYSGGFIWDPMKDVSMTLDYFDIRRKHEITRSGNTELLANEDAPPTSIYYNRVIRGPAAGDGLPGPVQALRRFYFNGGATLVKGFDFDGIWNVNIGEYGKLINRASATYYKSWKGSSTDDGPLTEFVAYRLPRVRATIGTTWVYQDFSTGLTFNHVHGYHTKSTPTANCAGATYGTSAAFPTPFCEVRSMNWADAVFQYRGFKNLDLTLTVRNVTDKHPPLDILALPANFTYHPYQGMYATLGGVYRFK
jgi:iron complex outermembrane receptor protein